MNQGTRAVGHVRGGRWSLAFAGAAMASELLVVTPAMAVTEMPPPYDARSVGMGATGVAHCTSGAAIYHNPANLTEVNQLTLTATFTPAMSTSTTPVEGPSTSRSSDASLLPFFLLGGGYRLSQRVVLGAGVYPIGGFGGTYNNVAALGGQKLSMQVATIEVSPVVTLALLENLAFSVGYRVTIVTQKSTLPMGIPPTMVSADMDMSGANYLGVQTGLSWRATRALRMGLVYRSKVTTKMTGTTTINGSSSDTSTKFSSPHGVKAGVAYELLPDKLMLAADFRYLAYSSSSKEMVIKVSTPAGPQENVQNLGWKDVYAGYFGAEYWVHPRLAVRTGYSFTTSATPRERPNALYTIPGLFHDLHAGVGTRWNQWSFDLAGMYSWASTEISSSDIAPDLQASTFPGTYSSSLWFVSGSVTYRR
jgi:long-chain fatty acid transport protein